MLVVVGRAVHGPELFATLDLVYFDSVYFTVQNGPLNVCPGPFH